MSKEDGRFSTVIRVSLRDAFFKEEFGGKLINNLLERHYKHNVSNNQPDAVILSNKIVKDNPGITDQFDKLAEKMLEEQEKSDPDIPECCLNPDVQCKHWIWDGVKGVHVNSYTHEVVDANI